MLVWIAFLLLVSGVICGLVTGNTEAMAREMLQAPAEVVMLMLKIGGSLCFFSGLMKVAEGCGLVGKFSRLLARPLGVLLPKTRKDKALQEAVSMNLASNFFGLGNAATPYGIMACNTLKKGPVSRSLAAFVLLNTCSVQLIPTTISALRAAAGSENAADIYPAVWMVQGTVCSFALLLSRLYFREAK